MKTLTLTDETGKVLYKTNVDNWQVDQVRDGGNLRISITGWATESVKVDEHALPPWTVVGSSHDYPKPHKKDCFRRARVSYTPPDDERARLKQSFLTDGPNPCGEVPLNEPEPGVSGGPLTREAWPSWAKKMAEEQEAAVAKLAPELRAKSGDFPNGLVGPGRIEDRFRFRVLQGPKPTKNMLLMNLTEPEKCRCDIKDLMSTGHAPKCPEAKKR